MKLEDLKKRLGTLVERIRFGNLGKKAELPESNKAQEGDSSDLGETIPLVEKPDDYDDKKEAHDEQMKETLVSLRKRDTDVKWKKKGKEPGPGFSRVTSASLNDGGCIVIDEDLRQLILDTIKAGAKEILVESDLDPAIVLADEDEKTEADEAFDYAVDLVKKGMPALEAIEQAKRRVPKAASIFVDGVLAATNLHLIQNLVEADVKFTVGPTKYLRRLAALADAGQKDLTGISILDSDYGEGDLRDLEGDIHATT